MDRKLLTAFDLEKEAQRVFDSVLLDEPTNFYALYGKALMLYKDGKWDDCVELMDQAIELKPKDTEGNFLEMRDKIKKLALSRAAQGRSEMFRAKMFRLPIAGHKIGQAATEPKDKNYHCKICDKNFTKQFSLNRHNQMHNGDKPHKCNVCRKAFIQKTDMMRHETTHSETLSFQCSLCEKKFKTKKNLNCHLITHSTDRPFKCNYCEKDFRVKRLWRFHEGLHKDTKP